MALNKKAAVLAGAVSALIPIATIAIIVGLIIDASLVGHIILYFLMFIEAVLFIGFVGLICYEIWKFLYSKFGGPV